MKVAMVGNGRSVHVTGRSAAMAARGHAVRLVTLGPVLDAPGVEVRTRAIPTTIPAAIQAARAFLVDVRSFTPDVLHLHYAGGKLGTMASLTDIHPFVVTVMGGDVLPEQHPGGMSWLERRATGRVLQAADLILVKSDALRAAVAELGAAEMRVETVRWGVDPAVFHHDSDAAAALRQRLGLDPRDRILVSPRILAPLYNVHLIVEALPAVLARVPQAVLLVTEYAADPAYRQRVAEAAVRLGVISRVRFIGRIEHRDMPALYSLADLVVSIPSSDGLPQSLFEAMACGAPVVLSRLRAYGEVVRDGENAVLADLQPASLASAMLALLESPPRASEVARAALARVREVADLPTEIARVEAFYLRALTSARPHRASWAGRLADIAGLVARTARPQ
jgi:glycosyltransferase involved in cell wall biosynthesis